MYRHRVKKAPSPVFGDTLEAMQYTINEQRKLVDADGKAKESYMAHHHNKTTTLASPSHASNHLYNPHYFVNSYSVRLKDPFVLVVGIHYTRLSRGVYVF